jgi:hypothetical protein
MRAKANAVRQRYRLKPELRRQHVAINVNVRRLAQFMAPEVKPVWSGA